MARSRVKICGITRPEDGLSALAAGADAIGLVFYEKSPRHVTLDQARAIALSVGPFVAVTALFVNASNELVEQVLTQVPVNVLQFHGEESAEFCQQFQRPWIKAVRVKPTIDIQQAVAPYDQASAILFDSYKQGVQGGTGEVFDWNLLTEQLASADMSSPVVLAGGLRHDNVADAIRQVQPYAVDVSGGVESAPGIKDEQEIERFMQAVLAA